MSSLSKLFTTETSTLKTDPRSLIVVFTKLLTAVLSSSASSAEVALESDSYTIVSSNVTLGSEILSRVGKSA